MYITDFILSRWKLSAAIHIAEDQFLVWKGEGWKIFFHLFFLLMTIFEFLELDREELAKLDIPRNYITFYIVKSNGKRMRRIDAPLPRLKEIQKQILHKLIYKFKPHELAHGFVVNRNPATNAQQHVGKKFIVKVDIKNFFPSIKTHQVDALIRHLAIRLSLTWDIIDTALIANVLCFNGSLPQGSPASPAITNLICYALDVDLAKLQYSNSCIITRYADDITASTDTYKNALQAKYMIIRTLRQYNFVSNRLKLRIVGNHKRQKVTGIVINNKLNTTKETWRNLRAAIHNLSGGSISEKVYQQLRGKIEWLKSLNPARGEKLLSELTKISVNKLSTAT